MRAALLALVVAACGAKQPAGRAAPPPPSSPWFCHVEQADANPSRAVASCTHVGCAAAEDGWHIVGACTQQAIVYCYSLHDDEGGEGDGHNEDVCTPDAASCNARAREEGDYFAGQTTVTAPCAPFR